MRSEFLVVIATFFATAAQLSFKLGANSPGFIAGPVPINLLVFFGFVSYGISTVLFIFALRGGQLSVLYPIWALSFVWIFLVSILVLNETVNAINWLGIGFIIAGVSLVGRGPKNA